MPLQFPQSGSPGWFRYAEQIVQQHRTDLQRLWQVIPPVPDPQTGLPFTGPISPTLFWVPSPSSGSSTSSGGP
jgi:hypothetical protein